MKAEIYRVAERDGAHVLVLPNGVMAIPLAPRIEHVIVGDGQYSADD